MQLQIERAQQIMQIISIGKNHEKLTVWHYSDIWKIWWNISWFHFNCLWNIMEIELSWIRLRSHIPYIYGIFWVQSNLSNPTHVQSASLCYPTLFSFPFLCVLHCVMQQPVSSDTKCLSLCMSKKSCFTVLTSQSKLLSSHFERSSQQRMVSEISFSFGLSSVIYVVPFTDCRF